MRTPALLLFTLALLATACSSSSSGNGGDGGSSTTPCNDNPWECPSSQTCWPQTATAFACLNAGPGTLGSDCTDTVSSPTCGAGLACFQAIGATGGQCLAFCSTTDPSHACTGGDVCETVALGGAGGPEFSVCVSPTGSDAGTEASAPGDSGVTAEAATGD